MSDISEFTVGDYVLHRLSEVGVRHLFGVPGDYNLEFLDHVIDSEITWVGNSNELNAAYAADGYARIKGVGALLTTYGVGELSAVNGIAGAYAEYVPVIHIVGAPSTGAQRSGALMHHTLGDGDYAHFGRVHAEITVAHAVLDTSNAATEIDRVISACLRERRPVCLILPTDVAASPIEAPATALAGVEAERSDQALADFVEHARSVLAMAASATVLADFLVDRFGVGAQVRELLAVGRFPYATLSMGKGALDESDPHFAGIYAGKAGPAATRVAVEQADAVIAVGVRFTDNITTGFSQDIATDRLIDLQPFEARIGDERYAPLPFADAVAGLVQLVSELSWDWHQSIAPEPGPAPSGETTLRQQDLWHTLQSFLRPGDIVLAEQGTAFYGACTLRLPTGVTFIGQPLWASIGYTLPAAFGAQTAAPDRRALLLIGDGSALMTAQEIGSMIRDDQHPIIVVINNGGYTFERTIHGTDERYNDIARWDWQLLPEAMGGGDRTIALRASTPAEFTEALAAAADTDRLVLVEAVVPTLDVPELLAEVSRSIAAANAAD